MQHHCPCLAFLIGHCTHSHNYRQRLTLYDVTSSVLLLGSLQNNHMTRLREFMFSRPKMEAVRFGPLSGRALQVAWLTCCHCFAAQQDHGQR